MHSLHAKSLSIPQLKPALPNAEVMSCKVS